MDSVDEDISARVLLRRVLHTELPRSPVTRSVTHLRRSMRSKNTPGLESPGVALRHRLKKKLHESASHSPVLPPKRQKSLGGKTNPPATSASPLYDEDITTRGLLKGIIQTETETSLLMSGQPLLQNSEPNAADSTASSTGERTEGLSGMELSDLTLHTEPLTHVVRGLSRRKPQRALSVSWFEKQLEQLPDKSEVAADVSQEKQDVSQDLDFSAGSKSGLNLTLKTPFVEKRTERAGLQRKVSNRRLPSVDAFDEAVQRCLEQGYNQGNSVFQDGKSLEDSSWQKFTLGLNDVTELYVQPAGSTAQLKRHDTLVPSAELEREHDLERNGEENLETQDGDIPEVPELLNKEDKEHDMESASQDVEQEEMVPSSQEAGDGMSLSSVNEIVLAPTQAMTESLPESQDVEIPETQTEEDVEEENVPGDIDASTNQERITRRAHRSEGGGVVLGVPPGSRVTKSLGTGLNPREKDLLDFVNGSRESLQNIPDEEIKPQDGPVSPLYPAAEVNTPERRSQKHVSSLAEEDLPQYAGDDAPEEVNQSEEEDMIEPEEVYQSTEHHSPAEEEEDLIDSEPDNQSAEPQSPDLDEQEDNIIEPEAANQSAEPHSPDLDEQEDIMIEPEAANQSAELHSPAPDEQEDIMIEPEAANQSAEPHSPAPDEQEEEEDDDDDDARSAELSMKTPAFVRQKRVIASPCARDTPTVLKQLNAGPASQVAKRARRQKRQTGSNVLPKSYIMSVFKHFAKTKVASDVFPAINEILKKYFDRLADDLEAYAAHAKRKTIEVEDFELLMRRQGFVTDNTPVNILIEKYLPLEYRKLLIPVATSGNKVIPNQRR
ncbi:uncharacterized protein cenpt [Myxocyprinus asiaticus]|uniref:uncharacterized protein cenpt n=1 Tax=Myxocyprinus asiaticus TaxID=70543 RepID=UPI002222C39E|nr:uncharacterized protein cenpt [Myxocyprinus asiaticus]